MAFVPENAPMAILFFLLTSLTLIGSAAALLWCVVRKRLRRARTLGTLMAVVVILYAAVLLGRSLTSRDRLLEPGQLKYFCEVDCHLACSVERAGTAASLGDGPATARARGIFYVVKVKTWFDPGTVAPGRGDAPLQPNPRQVMLEDGRGRRYPLSEAGSRALGSVGPTGHPLARPLRPGESYTEDLVFDLPPESEGVRLLIVEATPEAPFLVGHEASFFHRKVWFRVPVAGTRPEEPRHGVTPREARRSGGPAAPA